jgi:hypothetical protein
MSKRLGLLGLLLLALGGCGGAIQPYSGPPSYGHFESGGHAKAPSATPATSVV